MTDLDPGWQPVADAAEPVDVLDLHDLPTMLEVTHPIRGLILRRLKQPHTVAEVAASMGVPVTRLYHHVNHLADAGLIQVVATRQVAAVTERQYRVVAQSYRISQATLEVMERPDLAIAMGSVFDLAKLELQWLVESGGFDPFPDAAEHPVLSLAQRHLTDDRRRELYARLTELVEEFASDAEPGAEGTTTVNLFVAAFPEAPTTSPPNRRADPGRAVPDSAT